MTDTRSKIVEHEQLIIKAEALHEEQASNMPHRHGDGSLRNFTEEKSRLAQEIKDSRAALVGALDPTVDPYTLKPGDLAACYDGGEGGFPYYEIGVVAQCEGRLLELKNLAGAYRWISRDVGERTWLLLRRIEPVLPTENTARIIVRSFRLANSETTVGLSAEAYLHRGGWYRADGKDWALGDWSALLPDEIKQWEKVSG